MLQNLSLRHVIPLLFLAGSLLVVVIFYGISLPSAKRQIEEIGVDETRSLMLTIQGRLIEHLINDRHDLIRKEIYFASTDHTVKRVLLADSNNKILYANRSRFVGDDIADAEINLSGVRLPYGASTTVIQQYPNEPGMLLGTASLRFRKNNEFVEYSFIILRDYSPLIQSISRVAAAPAEIVASAMLLISIAVILLLRSHLDKRLTPLISAAAKLAKGNTRARANLDGADEFSEIGASFDKMAQRIEHTHNELNEAKENVEKASKARNQFVGLMSHEIQTPLAGLIGFIELLQDTKLDHEGQVYVRSANSAARTLSGLVDDLFESSRLENGTITLNSSTFCLNSLLQDIVDSVLPRTTQKGLSLKVIASESNPIWIESDPRLFRQILMNLLGNAVQFTENGNITITVSTFPSSPSMLGLSISVVDTGIGISPEDIERLFERFYKAADVRAQASPGSGVGLAICKELAELMGGSISVESKLDQGSTFTLEIEVAKADEPKDLDLTHYVDKELEPQHILLIEKSEIIRSLLENILRKWGHTVTSCSTSDQVISAAQKPLIYPDQKRYSLVLVDLHMPVIDGFALAQEIRGMDAQNARLPFIGLSTSVDPAIREKCLEAGIQGYMTKPINRKKLADEIFRLTRLAD